MTDNDRDEILQEAEALTEAAAALEDVDDPEADAVVEDALEIDSIEEAEAAFAAAEDAIDVALDDAVLEVVAAEAEAEAAAAAEDTVEVEEAAEAVAEVDPYDEFKRDLRGRPGRWYVVHSYAGFEKSVKQNIQNRAVSLGMEDAIYEIQVPMENVVEIKNGQRKLVSRVRIPSYVLVRMDLTEDSWSVVRHTPGVTGFVGNAHNPVPLRFDEVFGMLKSEVQIPDAAVVAGKGGPGKGGGASRAIPTEIDFEVGETITIKEGSFAGLPGTIDAIDAASGKLTVLVSLFERETPVTLGFDQVTKL